MKKIDSVNNSLNEKIEYINNSLGAIIDVINKRMSNQYFVNRVAFYALVGAIFTALLTAIRYFWLK